MLPVTNRVNMTCPGSPAGFLPSHQSIGMEMDLSNLKEIKGKSLVEISGLRFFLYKLCNSVPEEHSSL